MTERIDTYPILKVSPASFSGGEWMGSKEKFWFSSSGNQAKEWLFKYPRPNSGEHWAEKIAAETDRLLDIDHAPIELAMLASARGVASKTIVKRGWKLVHGNQILTEYVRAYHRPASFRHSQHTLDNIWRAFERVLPTADARERIQCQFAEYLILDALIGNTDRHDENWGMLAREIGNARPELLAPSFDHASSLGRELSDTQRERILTSGGVEQYVSKGRGGIYGVHVAPVSPLDLALQVMNLNPSLFHNVGLKLKTVHEGSLRRIVERMPPDWMSHAAKAFALAQMCYSLDHLRSMFK